jgi:hypothetical protein
MIDNSTETLNDPAVGPAPASAPGVEIKLRDHGPVFCAATYALQRGGWLWARGCWRKPTYELDEHDEAVLIHQHGEPCEYTWPRERVFEVRLDG